MSRYPQPGAIDLATRAEQLPNLRSPAGQDRRSEQEYAQDLAAATDRSLRKSAGWRAGRPMADHTDACDCPVTVAGCVERRPWPTIGDLGSGRNVDGRRGRQGGTSTHGRYSTYAHGCRCQECGDAATTYQRDRRARMAAGRRAEAARASSKAGGSP